MDAKLLKILKQLELLDDKEIEKVKTWLDFIQKKRSLFSDGHNSP